MIRIFQSNLDGARGVTDKFIQKRKHRTIIYGKPPKTSHSSKITIFVRPCIVKLKRNRSIYCPTSENTYRMGYVGGYRARLNLRDHLTAPRHACIHPRIAASISGLPIMHHHKRCAVQVSGTIYDSFNSDSTSMALLPTAVLAASQHQFGSKN